MTKEVILKYKQVGLDPTPHIDAIISQIRQQREENWLRESKKKRAAIEKFMLDNNCSANDVVVTELRVHSSSTPGYYKYTWQIGRKEPRLLQGV